MATPSTLILNSLIMIGEKSIGGTLTSDEQTHHLARLNAMMESFSLDRLMCYQVVEESKALTSSVGSYTIGSGGAWDTARPTKIASAWIRDSDNIDSPLGIVSAETYNRIADKTLDGSTPDILYYDSAFASSLATIYLWPEPAANLTLYISSWKQLQTFALISTTVALPPGYQEMIESNYAIRAAAGYRTVPAEVVKIARDSKAALMRLNAPEGILRMPAGVGGANRPNILIGA